ncbi:MAG: hypothetical protein KF753_18015 [Caldilineaceae bacterium]|nr:hypothetical protein [Caldilineaceae bacterium]
MQTLGAGVHGLPNSSAILSRGQSPRHNDFAPGAFPPLARLEARVARRGRGNRSAGLGIAPRAELALDKVGRN